MITLPQSHGFAFSLTGLFCGVFLVSWMSVSNVPGKQVKFREKASLRWPYLFGAQKREGGAGATPASVAPDALRVQTLRKQVFRFPGPKKKPACAGSFLYFGAQKREGGAGATPASVASDAFRVLARSKQLLRFLGKEKASLRWLYLVFGAQKRTRTSTPCGTRT